MIFYFSGCGNSRFVAKELSEALGEELVFIPDAQREGMKEYKVADGESVGFVFPIYSWASPKLVDDFVESVKWIGKPKYVWFACTCGDEMGKARQLFMKTLQKVGLVLNACYCFQMPETYLDFPGFHLDTDEGAKKKIDAAREKLPAVIAQIKEQKTVWDEIVGPLPITKSYLIRPGFVKFVSDSKYHCNDDCISCGKCVEVCPLKNISLEPIDSEDAKHNKRPVWHGNCTQCMACYHYCPKNAIHYASYTKGKGQYHF